MRSVAATAAAEPLRWPMPDRAELDAVRHLDTRFPGARLRQVPVVRASELDTRADPNGATRVWLALEALQVTGSFKVRGALVSLDANRSRGHVVAVSAGNHGVAVAYAANVLGLSATVCVPRTAPRSKRAKIEKYGADLVVAASDHYEDAADLARATAAAQGAAFVSQYEDAGVIAGNGASLGFEIVRALGGVPEHVIAPFGGGRLATGLAWALSVEGNGASGCRVWGVQRAASYASSRSIERRRGRSRSLGEAPERADFLAAALELERESAPDAEPVAQAAQRANEAIAGVIVATESQIAAAMAHAYRDMGLVVESSGIAALVPVLAGLPTEVRGGDLVVVLTGRNVDPERLDATIRAAGNNLPL